jgi:hypothetical protein
MEWRKLMTKLKVLSAALIAAAMFALPATARTSHESSRYVAGDTNSSTFPAASFVHDHAGISAPSVGAFLRAPPDGENCDVGDNPEVC